MNYITTTNNQRGGNAPAPVEESEMDLKTLEKSLVAHANMGMDAIYAENNEALKFHKNAIDEIHALIEKLKGETKC